MTLRCEWAGNDPLMQKYHDEKWGTPKRDDRRYLGPRSTSVGMCSVTTNLAMILIQA